VTVNADSHTGIVAAISQRSLPGQTSDHLLSLLKVDGRMVTVPIADVTDFTIEDVEVRAAYLAFLAGATAERRRAVAAVADKKAATITCSGKGKRTVQVSAPRGRDAVRM